MFENTTIKNIGLDFVCGWVVCIDIQIYFEKGVFRIDY
jgi:hypothetical protein